MKKLFDLTGKISVVTGGAGLLGTAIAQSLAAQGSTVYIAENDERAAQKTAVTLSRKKLKVHSVFIDITDPESVRQCIERLVKKHKRLDVWINNAYPRTADWGLKFEKIPKASWDANTRDHLGGYFLCCQQAAEAMKNTGKPGSIINMASIYGIIAPDFEIYRGTPMTMPAAYSAIKGGIISFTKYLASYYGKSGIRVNCISPGGIENKQPRSFIQNYKQKTFLGRMASPEDITGAAVYLASDASAYVTGHNLVVDGGFTVS